MSLKATLETEARKALRKIQINKDSAIADLETELSLPRVRFQLTHKRLALECIALFDEQRQVIEIQVSHPLIEGKITYKR